MSHGRLTGRLSRTTGHLKFFHAADLHLDSPLRGLDRYEGAPAEAVRDATRRALANLVDQCLAERVDFLLLAGDIYDGNWKDYRTGLFFQFQMTRLREASIPVFLVRGNHDAESVITRHLRLPDNVKSFDSKRAGTDASTLQHLGVAVHGQSFAARAVTADLAAGYPAAIPGLLNVGVLHTCGGGREGHEPYAPCSLDTLRSKDYAYWALGHVHAREVWSRDPWVVFPGNTQGRHAREAGPKGATLVTAEDGVITSVEHRPLDVLRWCVLDVDASAAADGDHVVDLVRAALELQLAQEEGRLLAARVVVRGTSQAHRELSRDVDRWTQEIRGVANDVGGGQGIWVERVELGTRTPLDLAALAAREDAIGQLVRALRDTRGDEVALRVLIDAVAPLKAKLPPELRDGPDGLRLDDPAWVTGLLDDVGAFLLPRLLEREDPP